MVKYRIIKYIVVINFVYILYTSGKLLIFEYIKYIINIKYIVEVLIVFLSNNLVVILVVIINSWIKFIKSVLKFKIKGERGTWEYPFKSFI